MALPQKLAGARDYPALIAALIQTTDTAVSMDTRVKAIQRAFASATAADFESMGAPAGSGATYVQMMLDFNAFLGSPAWTKMLTYVDQLRDIGR